MSISSHIRHDKYIKKFVIFAVYCIPVYCIPQAGIWMGYEDHRTARSDDTAGPAGGMNGMDDMGYGDQWDGASGGPHMSTSILVYSLLYTRLSYFVYSSIVYCLQYFVYCIQYFEYCILVGCLLYTSRWYTKYSLHVYSITVDCIQYGTPEAQLGTHTRLL